LPGEFQQARRILDVFPHSPDSDPLRVEFFASTKSNRFRGST